VGIVFAFNNLLVYSCYAIAVAAIFDFLDGLAARMLKAYSPMGKELDSLADIVSFGVLPAIIIYNLFLQSPQIENISLYLNFSAFLIAIGSSLRLANFNIDERQSENFIGLPTPANAILIASLPLILADNDDLIAGFILNSYFLVFLSVLSFFLLLMPVQLMSLKFKTLGIDNNLFRYILLFSGLILILIFKLVAVPLIILLYIILSIIQFRIIK
jgi:CDP-diacylglycerol--serine O-phosphatidyltransferase